MSSAEHVPTYGQICWLEIPVADAARAKAFYSAVMGWECPAECSLSPPAGASEVHVFCKGALHGCFLVMEPGNHVVNTDAANPTGLSVLPSIEVPDLEEATKEAVKLGGKVLVGKTMVSSGRGFFSRLIDSEGNLIGIYAMK